MSEPIKLEEPLTIKIAIQCNDQDEMGRVLRDIQMDISETTKRNDIYVIPSTLFQILQRPYVDQSTEVSLRCTMIHELMNSYMVLVCAPKNVSLPYLSIAAKDKRKGE